MGLTLEKLDAYRWKLPKTGGMNVDGIVYAADHMMGALEKENALAQVANVAHLPGIVKASLAMPDFHWGYGFPIGGAAAFDWEDGVVSPGGVGYDINCGVRLCTTGLLEEDIRPKLPDLADALYRNVPCGVGATGSVRLKPREVKQVLAKGSRWAVENGYGTPADLDHTEDGGCLFGADPKAVSDRALTRGQKQLGTLGSGNHFLEIQVVDEIFDPDAAKVFGLAKGRVAVMLHSGSRGLGYQVCDDYLAKMGKEAHALGIRLPDRQLACAKIQSEAGRAYLAAMACAANYAWANRQVMTALCRRVFETVLHMGPRDLAMNLLYDVCHNIAKKEEHVVDGKKRVLCVHRKGATRAFGPGHPLVPGIFAKTGQPILIPGDMGRFSYVLKGTRKAMDETFGTTCHGAGRVLSRKAAQKAARGRNLVAEMEDRGILVRWTGRFTLAEEMPEAYKDVSDVVEVVHGSGISEKVARMRPLAVVKG